MNDENNTIESIKKLTVADSPRNRRYSQRIDAGLDEMLTARVKGYGTNQWANSFNLDRLPFGDAENTTVRIATAFTGYMAFCWANRWSAYYGDARLLAHIKSRLLGFAEQQQGGAIIFRGRNVFSDLKFDYNPAKPIRDSHENSWYIEPLIYATWWIEKELSRAERQKIETMVRRAADMHAAIPINDANNRGVIRNAILCLAGRFLNDPNLIDIGIRDFHREPIRVFNEKDGQINEGTGPDANYSGTSYVYAYIYRLFSGDASIDRQMIDGIRWATRVFDPRGMVTLFGASTRMPFPGEMKIADYLPALERYADLLPHLSWLIEHGYLDNKALSGCFHCVSPLIWAMLEHNGKPPVEDPDWFGYHNLKHYNPKAGPELMYTNEGYATLYFMFRADYHASATVYGRSPYKGFQHWSYRQEPPVIWPTESHASKSRAWGIDTSHYNASGAKFRDKVWIEGPPHILVVRFENIWHHYVLTQTTTVLLISSSLAPREDIWVLDKKQCGTPVLEKNGLTYPGRRGRMHFPQNKVSMKELENAWHLRFESEARTHLYAFSNESFRLLDFNPEGDRLRFADDTGEYELAYELKFHADEAIRSIAYGTNNDTSKVKTRIHKLNSIASHGRLE